jgi:predicted small secreted protein
MKRTLKLAFLSVIAIAAFPACNTAIGLGRDMRVLGTEMERKADETYSGGASSEDYSGGAPVY